MPRSGESIQHSIRPLTPSDQLFLWEMLYQSLFVPENGRPFERSVLDQPEIARYVKDWGRLNDIGFVAEVENAKPVGTVWLRLFTEYEKGFGYIDDKTPELGMAVAAEYRGKGIGTSLLKHLICSVENVFAYVSLSVSVENPVIGLYKRIGFEVVGQEATSITMKRRPQGVNANGRTSIGPKCP